MGLSDPDSFYLLFAICLYELIFYFSQWRAGGSGADGG